MQVICNYNRVIDIPPKQRPARLSESCDYSFLPIGKKLTVYSIMFGLDGVDFLICLDNSNPDWIPSVFFEFLDARCSSMWSLILTSNAKNYDSLRENFGIFAIIGYKKLIKDPAHYDGILERNNDELVEFFREKVKIDSEFEENQ